MKKKEESGTCMDKIRQFLYKFMQGRYGTDELGKTTLIVSVILYIIYAMTGWGILYSLAFLGTVYALFRSLSKDINKRYMENQRFLKLLNLNKVKFDQRKEYKIFRCKKCGRNIRVPRKKGKIEVTCPVCGNKTIHRT